MVSRRKLKKYSAETTRQTTEKSLANFHPSAPTLQVPNVGSRVQQPQGEIKNRLMQDNKPQPAATTRRDDLRGIQSFNHAFGEARKRGLQTFQWGKGTYGTKLASEVQPKQASKPTAKNPSGYQSGPSAQAPAVKQTNSTADNRNPLNKPEPAPANIEHYGRAPKRPITNGRLIATGNEYTGPIFMRIGSYNKERPSNPIYETKFKSHELDTPNYNDEAPIEFPKVPTTQTTSKAAPKANPTKRLDTPKDIGYNPYDHYYKRSEDPKAGKLINWSEDDLFLAERDRQRVGQAITGFMDKIGINWRKQHKQGGSIKSDKDVKEFAAYLYALSGAKDEGELQDFITNSGANEMKEIYSKWENIEKVNIMEAKQGAKLQYIMQLRGQCPDGYEMVKFAKGGVVCSACKKKAEAQFGEKGTKLMTSFKEELAEQKCGGKVKKKPSKKQKGGDIPYKKKVEQEAKADSADYAKAYPKSEVAKKYNKDNKIKPKATPKKVVKQVKKNLNGGTLTKMMFPK